MVTHRKLREFRHVVVSYYKTQGRQFPWRTTRKSYAVFVSEVMLHQTQTDRVLPKYRAFLNVFPTWEALARAPLKAVLQEWRGLGYNRRARFLWEAAHMVVTTYRGRLPSTLDELCTLPGVGPYTAGALLAFVFNKPSPFIETNIRSVFIHHFFPDRSNVSDRELLPLIEQTVDHLNPREWYYALMDYGVYLKRTYPNPSRRSAHHIPQSRFKGSVREIRGRIVKVLSDEDRLNKQQLRSAVQSEEERFNKALSGLLDDRLVRKNGAFYFIG